MLKRKKIILCCTVFIILVVTLNLFAQKYDYINKLIINEKYQKAINAIIEEAKKDGYNSELKRLTAKIEQLIELDKKVYRPVEIYGKEYIKWRKNRENFHRKSMVVGALLAAYILDKVKESVTYDQNLISNAAEVEKHNCKIYIDVPWAPDPLVGYIKDSDIFIDVSFGPDEKIGYFKENSIYSDIPWAIDEKVGYIENEKVYADIPWAFDESVGYVDGDKIFADIPGFDEIVGRIEGKCGIKGAGAFFLITGYFYREKFKK